MAIQAVPVGTASVFAATVRVVVAVSIAGAPLALFLFALDHSESRAHRAQAAAKCNGSLRLRLAVVDVAACLARTEMLGSRRLMLFTDFAVHGQVAAAFRPGPDDDLAHSVGGECCYGGGMSRVFGVG